MIFLAGSMVRVEKEIETKDDFIRPSSGFARRL